MKSLSSIGLSNKIKVQDLTHEQAKQLSESIHKVWHELQEKTVEPKIKNSTPEDEEFLAPQDLMIE